MKLKIEIKLPDDAHEEEIYQENSILKEQLGNFDTVGIEDLEQASQTTGSKGGPLSAALIFITLSPVILQSLLNYLQKWTLDRRKISVESPNGAKVEFTPEKSYSKEEILEFVRELNTIK